MPLLSSGGAERATAVIASSLDPDRYEPVIVLQSDGPRVYEPASHVRVVEVGAPRTHSAVLPLTRVLRRERPDLVYAVLPHLALLSAAAVRTMRAPAPKLVIGIHNNLGAELPQWSNGDVLRRLTPWAYRRADAILAVSTGVGEEAVRDFGADPSRVHVIPNPVDVDAIRAAGREQEPDPWLDDPALRVIVAMGRLVPQKNVPVLLGAFAQVAAEDPSTRLIILGDGTDRAELERQAGEWGVADRVRFAGAVAKPFGLLARAAAFVSSSDYEGFGLAHVEALALGVPVVSTDCDFGPGEVLGEGRFGVLTPVGASGPLGDAIGALLTDDARREALRAAGPGRADDFRAERVLPQVEALLGSLLRDD